MFFNNIMSAYKDAAGSDMDRGDLVQTIIIVATFAVVAIAVIGLIGNAIMQKGTAASKCINSTTTVATGTAAPGISTACAS